MLLLGAEFIAMLVVIVYVGAVAVLFLFVVMMLDVDFGQLRSGFHRNMPFAVLIALVLLAEIVIAVSAWRAGPALSGREVAATAQPNIVALGQLLYSRYLLPFELAGLILLVAMVGPSCSPTASGRAAAGRGRRSRSLGVPRMPSGTCSPASARG
jgi:NADH-quinone oxidoreductase subunit J